MRYIMLVFVAMALSGCLREETAKSAATIVELAKAQQDERADLATCKKLATGIEVLGAAIHKTQNLEMKPVVTAEEAIANPDRAVGRAESQAERLLVVGTFNQMAWNLAYWLGGLAASALTAATGIKFTSVVNGWRKAKKILGSTVSAIQSYREDNPQMKSTIDGYLEAAHDKLGRMAYTYIAHEKSNGIQHIVPKTRTSPAPPT